MGKDLAYIQVHLGPRQSPAQVVMEWEIQTTRRMAVDFQAWMDVSKRYMVINLFFNVILKINWIDTTNIGISLFQIKSSLTIKCLQQAGLQTSHTF